MINLLNASKKNEKVKIKNPLICIIIFLVASSLLGYAYWKVTADAHSLDTAEKILPPILIGIVGTAPNILVFIRIYHTSSSKNEKYILKRY